VRAPTVEGPVDGLLDRTFSGVLAGTVSVDAAFARERKGGSWGAALIPKEPDSLPTLRRRAQVRLHITRSEGGFSLGQSCRSGIGVVGLRRGFFRSTALEMKINRKRVTPCGVKQCRQEGARVVNSEI
jgi:hypothetical protein